MDLEQPLVEEEDVEEHQAIKDRIMKDRNPDVGGKTFAVIDDVREKYFL